MSDFPTLPADTEDPDYLTSRVESNELAESLFVVHARATYSFAADAVPGVTKAAFVSLEAVPKRTVLGLVQQPGGEGNPVAVIELEACPGGNGPGLTFVSASGIAGEIEVEYGPNPDAF